MRKTVIITVVMCISILICVFTFTSCNNSVENKPQTDNTVGTTEPDDHEHILSDWIIGKAATTTETGERHRECVICGDILDTEEIPVIQPCTTGLTYEVNSDGESCTITGIGRCKEKNIYIGGYIDGYLVTVIGKYAFEECESIANVTIGDSVTTIGYGAFYCSSLSNVEIGNGVKVIDVGAFYECTELTSVIIPDNVTSLGDGAFSYCTGLKSVKLPKDLTSIGDGVFNYCNNMDSVTIPDSVTSIGEWAFAYCGLTSLTIPDSVTSVGEGAFYCCIKLTSVTIGTWLKSLDELVFGYCIALTSVTIPENIKEIGEKAFENCISLASVVFPISVKEIDSYAFSGCSSLTKITYAGSIEQWEKILDYSYWDKDTGDYTVFCTDGEIKKE